MSYTSPAVYCQRRPAGGGPPPGGDCDPYTKPSPTAITTDLTATPPAQTATAVDTNLCAPVS